MAEQIEFEKDDFEHFKFTREEIKFQHTLLGYRVSWYVASQAFLVTGFAISAPAADRSFVVFNWFSYFVLPVMGIILSLLILPAMRAARDRINDIWLLLVRYKFTNLMPALDRPSHTASLQFAVRVPKVFIFFWAVLILMGVAFLIVGGARGTPGRYQLAPDSGQVSGEVYIFDSQTGDVWRRGTKGIPSK